MDLERSAFVSRFAERTVDALAKAIAKAAQTADLIEIRLDCIASEDLKSSFDQINQLLLSSSIPAILTFRPAEQGGASDTSYEARYAFGKNRGCACASLRSGDRRRRTVREGGSFHSNRLESGYLFLSRLCGRQRARASWTGWPGWNRFTNVYLPLQRAF